MNPNKFEHYRFECVCGRMHDIRNNAATISHKCECGVTVFISRTLERWCPK